MNGFVGQTRFLCKHTENYENTKSKKRSLKFIHQIIALLITKDFLLYKTIHWSLSSVVNSQNNCLPKADLQCNFCLWIKRSKATILIILVFAHFFFQVNRPSLRITQIHDDTSKEEDARLFPGNEHKLAEILELFFLPGEVPLQGSCTFMWTNWNVTYQEGRQYSESSHSGALDLAQKN